MAKKPAKTASKNNPSSRGGAKIFSIGGRKIIPAKILDANGCTFSGAIFEGPLENQPLVLDADGHPLSWQNAVSIAESK